MFNPASITTKHRSQRLRDFGINSRSIQLNHMHSPKEALYAKSFQFVDTKSLGDTRTRRLVRSHVMLEFGRQQRLHKSYGRERRVEASIYSDKAEAHGKKSQDDMEVYPCASRIPVLGAGRRDPFSCFPIRSDLRIAALADHCGSSMNTAYSISLIPLGERLLPEKLLHEVLTCYMEKTSMFYPQ